MPDTVEAMIADLLLSRLAALPTAPAIAYPGVPFSPPAETYLEATLLMNNNVNAGVGNDSTTEFRGILQVTVMAASGQGIITALDLAGKIASHFERGSPIQGAGLIVRLQGRPSLAPPLQDPDRIRVPVSISFYAFA